MQHGRRLIAGAAIWIGLVAGVLFTHPSDAAGPRSAADTTSAGKLSEDLYKGFRATKLMGSTVFSSKGEYLGEIRNAMVSRDGQIEYAVVEGGGAANDLEFVFRIPWDRLMLPVLHTGALIANISDTGAREYGLFLDSEQDKVDSQNFQMSRLIGDYARLQAGQGYGYVSDLVFSPTGKMMAVLVARDKRAGGGVVAFAYPDRMRNWSPSMSYYGLPYVTAEQANQAGMAVNIRAFADSRS